MTIDSHAQHHVPRDLVDRYAAGDDSVGDAICRRLEPAIRTATSRFLPEEQDQADVIQDTLVAVLDYVRRVGRFEGDLNRFAVTVASNRCRDLLRWRQRFPHQSIEPLAVWIRDRGRSPLDFLLAGEISDLLRRGLAVLDDTCRDLLTGLYLGKETPESYRRRAGLKSVQAIYYRRNQCLQRLTDFFQSAMQPRSLRGNQRGKR